MYLYVQHLIWCQYVFLRYNNKNFLKFRVDLRIKPTDEAMTLNIECKKCNPKFSIRQMSLLGVPAFHPRRWSSTEQKKKQTNKQKQKKKEKKKEKKRKTCKVQIINRQRHLMAAKLKSERVRTRTNTPFIVNIKYLHVNVNDSDLFCFA